MDVQGFIQDFLLGGKHLFIKVSVDHTHFKTSHTYFYTNHTFIQTTPNATQDSTFTISLFLEPGHDLHYSAQPTHGEV